MRLGHRWPVLKADREVNLGLLELVTLETRRTAFLIATIAPLAQALLWVILCAYSILKIVGIFSKAMELQHFG